MAFRTKKNLNTNFAESLLGHKTSSTVGGKMTGLLNTNRELLQELLDDYSDNEEDEEFDIEAFTPLLREEEDEEEFDEITGEKKKKKIRKVNIIKGLPKIEPIISSAQAYGIAPHPNLLRPPFSMLIIAPKGSGKTTVSINLEKFYQGSFDNRIMVSPTFKIDDNWKAAIKNKVIEPYKRQNISSRYNDAKINKIWKAIKQENKSKDMFADKLKTHFLFDDVIGELPRTRDNAMYKISRNHRHYGVSATIISQEYNGLATPIRKNATGIILFGTTDGGEIKTIIEQQGGFVGKNRFLRMWAHCISKPFGFLFINKDLKDRHRYFCFFTEELNPLDFSNERVKDMIEELEIALGNTPNDNENTGNKIIDTPKEIKKITKKIKKNIPKKLKGKCDCKLKIKKDINSLCNKCIEEVSGKLHIETDGLSREQILKKINRLRFPIIKKMLKIK